MESEKLNNNQENTQSDAEKVLGSMPSFDEHMAQLDIDKKEGLEEEKKKKIKEIQTARQLINTLKQASAGSQSAMMASTELANFSQQIESVINGTSQEDMQKLVGASMQRLRYLKNEKFMMFPRQFGQALQACDNVMKILSNL